MSRLNRLRHTNPWDSDPVVLGSGTETFEFPADLPVNEIRRSLIGWAKKRQVAIRQKVASGKPLTADEILDESDDTPERIANDIIGNYRPDHRETAFTVLRDIAGFVLLPPVTVLALAWISLWVVRGFQRTPTSVPNDS
jgi:hypothetical protein